MSSDEGRIEAAENLDLAKACRSVQGQIIADRIERILQIKLEQLVMEPDSVLSIDERMKLSIQCAAIGEILRDFDGRITSAIQLAAKNFASRSMHVPPR